MSMKKRMMAAVLTALSLAFLGCSSGGSGGDYTPPVEKPPVETPDKTPSEDNKTYIEFQSHEVFPARIYKDPSHITLFAEVPAKGSAKVEASPNAMGVAFYPVFLVEIEGIPITQYGQAVTVRVDEKKVNKANIPALESIETTFAYVKIENADLYSLAFNQGSYELMPLGRDSTLIITGETGAYQIEPRGAQSYSFMRNASSPIPFPEGIREFTQDTIYSFRYDGSVLTLSSTKPLLPAPQNIVLKAGNGSITVTWDAAPTVRSYSVYYSTGPTPPETPAQTNITGTAATISEIANDTTYYVWVASVNAVGSNMSAAASVTVLPRSWTVASFREFTDAVSAINASLEAKTYTIILTRSINAGDITFTTNAKKTITIRGDASLSAIANTGSAALFTVPADITLILENNLHLNGNDKSAAAVSVNGGTLIMNAGSMISKANAGAVRISNNGAFTMTGGEVSGNSSASGGGVFVESGAFTMTGGEIRGNSAASGGGVYVGGGTFTMEGGKISGNTASSSGGGVFVGINGTFTKRGGSIIDATNSASSGKAAYVGGSPAKQRNTAAGPGIDLDSRISGSAGGWEQP